MSRRLPQYLKQERKHAGLSQADMAYLLGARGKTKIWAYERDRNLPSLQVALAYEALFGTPVAQLFPAVLSEVRKRVRRRVRQRASLLARQPPTLHISRRQRSLEKLLA